MRHIVPFPLNEPQTRHITAALAILEKHLAGLRDHLEHGSPQLHLTRWEDSIEPFEFEALRSALGEAKRQLRQIANDLALPASTESVRRAFLAAFELDLIHLGECRPQGELAGCGMLHPATAAYLERELGKLEAAVRTVTLLLLREVNEHDSTSRRDP